MPSRKACALCSVYIQKQPKFQIWVSHWGLAQVSKSEESSLRISCRWWMTADSYLFVSYFVFVFVSYFVFVFETDRGDGYERHRWWLTGDMCTAPPQIMLSFRHTSIYSSVELHRNIIGAESWALGGSPQQWAGSHPGIQSVGVGLELGTRAFSNVLHILVFVLLFVFVFVPWFVFVKNPGGGYNDRKNGYRLREKQLCLFHCFEQAACLTETNKAR